MPLLPNLDTSSIGDVCAALSTMPMQDMGSALKSIADRLVRDGLPARFLPHLSFPASKVDSLGRIQQGGGLPDGSWIGTPSHPAAATLVNVLHTPAATKRSVTVAGLLVYNFVNAQAPVDFWVNDATAGDIFYGHASGPAASMAQVVIPPGLVGSLGAQMQLHSDAPAAGNFVSAMLCGFDVTP